MSLLDLQNVGIARGGRELLSGLTLTVGAGDLIWVRGPNGSGKSTLLRAIADFLLLSSGVITRSQPPAELIAYLGHKSGLEPRASLVQEADFWLGERQGLAATLGIDTLSRRCVFSLSAGQMRKFEIARLRAAKKPLWLLDEPYAALDSAASDALTRDIAEHADAGGAAIIVSHQGLPAFGRDVRIVSIGEPS